MADQNYIRSIEEFKNKQTQVNQTRLVNQPWSIQYDPNRVNDPTYMGGLIPQEIRRAGVYNPVQTEMMPRSLRRDRRIFMKAPKPVYRSEEYPIPQQRKAKRKPVFETLFED